MSRGTRRFQHGSHDDDDRFIDSTNAGFGPAVVRLDVLYRQPVPSPSRMRRPERRQNDDALAVERSKHEAPSSADRDRARRAGDAISKKTSSEAC